ncbi:MAG: AMP-binding protein [Rubrivivax sp.]|nr:AMP-binding protein [Rubrivivax sp.]
MTTHSDATLGDVLRDRASRSGDLPGHWTLSSDGRWQSHSWSELHARVEALARGCTRLGLRPGDRVAFIATGTSDWDIAHWAVLAARGVVVGIDAHAPAEMLSALLELATPSALVVDRTSRLDGVRPELAASFRFVVTLGEDDPSQPALGPRVVSVRALAAEAESEAAPRAADSRPVPEDPAWIVFTSGTTGRPKGVLFRHRQIRAAMEAILDAFNDISTGDRLASWLPLSNPFQRIVNLCAAALGAQTYYVEDPRTIMEHLPAIRPHVFIGVPRFYEKFHAVVTGRMAARGGLAAGMAHWALTTGERASTLRRQGLPVPPMTQAALAVADGLVLRRIREAFGGRLRYLVSGSAPMPTWLLERLDAMGLRVLEAYGLSECIVPVATNRANALRFGTVGRAMKGVETRLGPDGELLIRSIGTFDGYVGALDEGGAVDQDGWLATGDLAQIDSDGFVRLVGRKSEVFKTSTGRRVAPQAVEAALRSVAGVEHAAVFGAGRATLLALVAVAPDADTTATSLRHAVRAASRALPDYQRPAGLVVTRQPLTIETGELTGNLKLRRQVVGERYADALAQLARVVDDPARLSEASASLPSGLELVLV